MNGFLTQCKVRKAELLQCIGFLAAAYLLGLVILCIVMNVAKGEGSATVGTGMAVVFFFFLHYLELRSLLCRNLMWLFPWERPEKALSQAMHFLIS